jgi:ribosomal protein S18 acetylase RimI-like enzyme
MKEIFAFFNEQVKTNMLQGMYLTVNKYNEHAIDVYKHYGFEIVDSVVTDIGKGFVMDDYIMYKNKE